MFLTPEQLAERWHMSSKTLANWRSKGTGPEYVSPGGKVLYKLETIEAFENDTK